MNEPNYSPNTLQLEIRFTTYNYKYDQKDAQVMTVIMASNDSYYNEIIEEIQRQQDEEHWKMIRYIRQIIDGHKSILKK